MNKPAFAQKIPLGLIALFCLLVLVAEAVEYQFFTHLKTEEKTFVTNELASIGQLKAGQLAAFLKERRGDSLVITDLLSLGLTQRWWTTKKNDLPASLQQPLKSAVAYYDYTGAMILDTKGNVRFRIGNSMRLSEKGQSLAQRILQTAPPPFSELYAADQAAPEQLMLDTFAPIKGPDKTTTVGVLVLRGNWPDLFTMIQSWPVESRTAETLLVEHDRNQVIVLNELRHKTQTKLKPHMPLRIGADAPPWPTIKAAQGQYGPLESFDHRGQAVLAHILPVQGTSWSMVVKMDTEEVLEHLRFLQSISATGTLIAAIGVGLWAHGWQRRREQARVRHEAQQVEHRLAAVIGSAMDAIISVDEDQRIVLFNPTAERLFGCTALEAFGQPLDRFIPERFRDSHREHIRAFGLSGKTTSVRGALETVSGIRANGQEFPAEASISQTQTDGHTLYTVILRDVSQRMLTEAALTQSEERLRLALVATNQGLYDLNLQTGECIVSPEYALMLGYDPAEFRETNAAWRERLHPDDREEAYRAYEDFVAGRRDEYCVEFRQRAKTGEWKWILSIGSLVTRSADGQPLRMLGIHKDISERKRSELRIEASLREKETLLREVHHRVKNNLQIISSLLHFQAKKAQKGHEQSIFSEGQDRLRAMILLHELLYRSTDLHRIPLGEYLKTLTDQLRRSFREAANHIHLRVEADDLSVPAAMALPCGMIVTELVTNALKYAYPTGKSGPVLVRIAARERSFLLSVSDEGTGLPTDFDLAQTGSFGLQLVANLADQLGATLTRPPGTGTEIVLEVPMPSRAVAPERPVDTRAQPFHQSESL